MITTKKIITQEVNKDNQKLIIVTEGIKHTAITDKVYSNTSQYLIFTEDSNLVGFINTSIMNDNTADTVEIEYTLTKAEYENKGNMSLALNYVLKDIFIDRSHDELVVRTQRPTSNIQEIFLSINENNTASKKVALKCGFLPSNIPNMYVIDRSRYLQTFENITKHHKH